MVIYVCASPLLRHFAAGVASGIDATIVTTRTQIKARSIPGHCCLEVIQISRQRHHFIYLFIYLFTYLFILQHVLESKALDFVDEGKL